MSKVVRDASIVAAGVGVLRKANSAMRRHDGAVTEDEDLNRWITVTVNRPPDEVAPGRRLPQPLAELGDEFETSVRAAPGDKGTELAARPRDPVRTVGAKASGEAPREEVRSALRRAKQLLEVGEVLSVDGQPAGKRSPTPTGKLVEAAAQRAGGEGLV